MLRTPLVLLFGSLIVGCTVGDPGTGGDDGDDTGGGGAVCGNGVKEGNEACDDGNAASGDGCSTTCNVEAVPRLDVTVDKPTISTELKTTHMVTVSLTAAGGFGGDVTLAPSVVDGTGTPLQGWTVVLDKTTVTLPTDGTGSAIATVTVPSTNKGLVGTVKIDVTGTGIPAKQVTSAVTALNQITFQMTLNGNNQCVYPPAGTVPVTIGTKLRWLNKAASNVTIHVGGNANTINHQADPGSPPNGVYEQTVTGNPGANISWYCHAPGPTVNNLILQPVAP